MALLIKTMQRAMSTPEWNAQTIELAQRSIAGKSVEGFEAEYIGEKSYEDRMIALMETQFPQD